MFRPLQLYSSNADPVSCPALLDDQPCTIPRCLFSHNVKRPPRPASFENTQSAEVKPFERPPSVSTKAPETARERRLREIVEGKTELDVAIRAGQLRISDKKRSVEGLYEAAQKPVMEVKAVESPIDDLASASSWPTPAQTSKKLKTSKGGGLSPDAFYGTQVSKPKTTAATNKAIVVDTMKTTAVRPLKRPAPESPSGSSTTIPQADPLKRPKTTTALPVPSKSADAKATAKPAPKLALNPRLVSRAPVQHGQRLQYLNLLYKEIIRLSGDPKDEESKQQIIKKCLDLEEEIATKKRDVYRSAISNLCMRLKKSTIAEYKKEQEEEMKKALPVPQPVFTVAPNRGLDNSKPPLDTGITKTLEVARLRELIASPEVLKQHNYVLIPPTKEEIEQARAGIAAGGGWETCERCTQRFQVFPGRRESDGALTTGGQCRFHPGRRAGLRPTPGSVSEQKWTCCSTVVGFDAGCTTGLTHVFKVSDPKRLAVTFPFCKTPPNQNVKGNDRAIAIDCEMSYTTLGMELIRLTATAFPSGKIVIDALVKPFGIVLDFNTQFSGVSADMLTSATPWKPIAPFPDVESTKLINPTHSSPPRQLSILASPAQARKELYRLINPETVLIGHALENDLLHLRMCHDAIVDTVVLFPHIRGLPVRNKLKYIVERRLGREIQVEGGDSGLDGHDSAVDARCAAELVRLKIKELEEKRKI